MGQIPGNCSNGAKFVTSSNGKVYSYEPQRIVFQQFCANVFLNSLDNVFAYNFALGDSVCEIQIPELDFWKSKNVGGFSIDKSIRENIRNEALEGKTFLNSENGDQNTVEQRTLDSFNFEFDINLIKVDVEGFELEFFIGGSNTIKAKNYPPIIFELWSGKSWYEQKAQKTLKILADWGYKFSEFGREILAQHPNHPIQCKIEDGVIKKMFIEEPMIQNSEADPYQVSDATTMYNYLKQEKINQLTEQVSEIEL